MRVIRLLAVACAAGFAFAAVAQQGVVIDYNHRIVNCDWLAKEYETILERNEKQGEEVDPNVVRARLLTIPLFIIVGDFGGDGSDLLPEATNLGGRVNFSGSVNDVAAAARIKNCYNLYDEIFNDQESGKTSEIVPAPVRSPIGTEK